MLSGSSVESISLSDDRLWQTREQINNTPHLLYISGRYITMQAMSVIVILVLFKIAKFYRQG